MLVQVMLPLRQSVTVRKHAITLVPHALIAALALSAGIAVGIHLRMLAPALGSAFLVALWLLLHLLAWWSFQIKLEPDRVKVCSLKLGFIPHTTLHPLTFVRGVACEQSPFGKMCDAGTLILHLPEHTLRYTMLTSYKALHRAID